MPQVKCPPPTEPKQRQSGKPRPTQYIHHCGKDAKPMPSKLEIAEGAAWKEWATDPTSEQKANAWNEAAFLLMKQQPHPALSRCASCGTRAYGRVLAKDGCGHCQFVGPPKYSDDPMVEIKVIAFSGHRDKQADPDALRALSVEFPHSVWVHGGAEGFDAQVEAVAKECGHDTIVIRPDYENNMPKQAPLLRNNLIVNKGSLLIALYDGRKGGGTRYTINYAESKNVPVRLLKPMEEEKPYAIPQPVPNVGDRTKANPNVKCAKLQEQMSFD